MFDLVLGLIFGEPSVQFFSRRITDHVEKTQPRLIETRLIGEARSPLIGDGARLVSRQHVKRWAVGPADDALRLATFRQDCQNLSPPLPPRARDSARS